MTGPFPSSSLPGREEEIHREFSSFRDPSGFLFWRDGALYRGIHHSYKSQFTRARESGFYESCLKDNLIVPFHIEDKNPSLENFYTVIKPDLISQVTYPYEWCFDQLKDAALLTLTLHQKAIGYGMVLKDASAYNVQFFEGRPCLIDHLSFDNLADYGMWPAYGQFCRHFLAPLALMSYVDLNVNKLLQIHIDGLPLDFASRLLPLSTRFKFGLQMHLHLHAKMVSKYERVGKKVKARSLTPEQLLELARSLENVIKRLVPRKDITEWGTYYSDTNYSDQAFETKKAQVRNMVDQVKPNVVWDIGGNDGTFSRVIADLAGLILCLDVDPVAVNKNYLICKQQKMQNIVPLVVDCTNPSPAIGFANEERPSLENRGKADLILALALLHHLVISHNLSLNYVARYFSKLGSYLIIEFVPKNDSQVERLLLNRKDIFVNYTEDEFRKVFSSYFSILREESILNSNRKLFLMHRLAS